MPRISLLVVPLVLSISTNSWAEPERLINISDMYPSVSPDSATLVFQSNRAGAGQIFAMDVGNTVSNTLATQLTNSPLGAETPVISPDGKKIVLSIYGAEGNNDVFVMNIDGSNLTQITFGPGYDGHPHWNADGTRIFFNSDRSTPDMGASWSNRWHEIFSVKSDGSDVRQHTKCKSVCTYGSVSPDGQKVLYRKVVPVGGFDWALRQIERNSEIFVIDIDGENETNLSNNAAFDGWPVWSPDGSLIAFASNRSGPERTGQIWTMHPDGSNAKQISSGDWSHTQPAWSADGHYIYAYQHIEAVDYEFGSVVKIELE